MLTDHDAHMWFESLKDLFDGTRNDVDAERRRRFSNAYMCKMGGKCYRAHMDKGWGQLLQLGRCFSTTSGRSSVVLPR